MDCVAKQGRERMMDWMIGLVKLWNYRIQWTLFITIVLGSGIFIMLPLVVAAIRTILRFWGIISD